MAVPRAKIPRRQPQPANANDMASTEDDERLVNEELSEADVYEIAKNWAREADRLREDLQMISTLLFCYHRRVSPRATIGRVAQSVGEVLGRCEKTIRDWIKELKENDGEFLAYGRGKHRRVTLLTDERCCERATKWVRENSCRKGQANMTVKDFMDYLNETLLPSMAEDEALPKTVCMTTARKFLHELGFERTDTTRKGVYRDGHERPDVVESRKHYIARLHDLEKAQVSPLPSDVIPDQAQPCSVFQSGSHKRLVTIYHDETTFQSNDDHKFAWAKEGDSFIKKKCRGSGIMISDFIDEYDGFLGFTDDQYENYRAQNPTSTLPQRARVRLEYGQNRDGYWRASAFVNQVKTAVEIAEIKYPPEAFDIVFVFEHSSNHAARAPDALVASSMNAGVGGKQPIMRDTIWNGSVQRMVLDDGRAKGLRMVLQERGVAVDGKTRAELKGILQQHDDFKN